MAAEREGTAEAFAALLRGTPQPTDPQPPTKQDAARQLVEALHPDPGAEPEPDDGTADFLERLFAPKASNIAGVEAIHGPLDTPAETEEDAEATRRLELIRRLREGDEAA